MSATVENAIKELTRAVKEQNKILEAINKNLYAIASQSERSKTVANDS